VCLEALLDESSNDVVGAVSGDGRAIEDLGVPLLGTDAELAQLISDHDVDAVCVAIGDNMARGRIIEWLTTDGHRLATARSKYAVVSPTATVGEGSHLLPGSVINAATTIGRATIVNTNASIDHDCRVGDFVHVAPGVAIGGAVKIGRRAFVGIGARVLPGLTIGEDSVVGGGAVVVDDVPAGATVVGVPAHPVGGG
jgi:UDP-perosamine 4-acetyltransferase